MGKNSIALQDAIDSIDKEIKHHLAEILFLRRRRNSLMPISHLPPEILAKILLINALEDFSLGPSSSRSWTNVTAVCSRWREVAVHCPELWSHWHSRTSGGWLSTFISRSKAVPLHLRFSHTYKDINIDPYEEIFSDNYVRGRIQEIEIFVNGGTGSSVESVFDAFKYSTIADNVEHQSLLQDSQIRTLSIRNEGPHRPTLKLPMQFMSNKFSHLQRLELINCEIGWDHLVFNSSSITTLKIDTSKRECCPSMTQILSILASKPNLQRLTLEGYAIPVSAHMAAPIVANLRHLNYIEFSANEFEGGIGIIRALSFPRNSTAIHLKSFYVVESQEYKSLMVPFISDYFSPSEPPKIDDSMYIYSLSTELYLRIECRPHFNPSNPTLFPIPTSIIEIPLRLETMSMLSDLPVANLRKLSIACLAIYPSPNIFRSDVFTYMDKLEELELQSNNSRTAVVALIPGQIDDQRTNQGCDGGIVSSTNSTSVADIKLPNLKRLLIRGVNLQRPIFQGISLLVALLQCVEGRSKAGHPLDSVTLPRHCAGQLQDVETVRKWTKLNYE